ncbi:MAG: Fur family transcriptional regulator [Opitutales bacterium]
MMTLDDADKAVLEQALEGKGLRSTRQRELVWAVLLNQRDHPTADEVYARSRAYSSSLSLATVYNCLETFAECGLVSKMTYDREPSRFCPKDEGEHAHFLDESTGRVYDIPLPGTVVEELKALLPEDFAPERVKLTFTGKKRAAQKRKAS